VYEGLIDAPHGIKMPTLLTLSDADARIVIGGTAGSGAPELAITGDATVTGSVTAASHPTSSDARLKDDIVPLSGCLDKVAQIKGVSFNYRAAAFPERSLPQQRQVGVLAQDVERVLPEIVQTDVDGYRSVDYGKLTAVLIEAVKEQQAEIESLKSQMEQMRAGR
jgi:hypothetical protein